MANSVDVVMLRKRKRAKKRLVRLLLVLAVAALLIFVYVKRDTWYPKLAGIGTRYQNITPDEGGEGDFALSISGGVAYSAAFAGRDLFILCDKYLYIYGADGTLKDSRQHAYSNAAMKTAGTRALVYSVNGTSFRVDARGKMIYELSTEQPIWFGALSEDGKVAIVTESETFACRMSVYDTGGELIYTRECVDRLSDISFLEDGCIFSTIDAADGELVTTLQCITFDSDEVQWKTAPLPTLCMKIYALEDGGAFVVGDTLAAYYSGTGALVGSYDYNAALTDYDCTGERGVVLLHNEQRRQSELLLFSDRSEAPMSVVCDVTGKGITIDGETAYLLGNGQIVGYAFSGQEQSRLSVQDAYDGILKHGNYFYLLGYDKIERCDAE